MSKDHLRVLLGVPSGPLWHASFGLSLAAMMVNFAMKQVPGYRSQELRLCNVKGSILPKNRLDIVKFAKREHADYILFLDTDHIFPVDTLHRLLAHRKAVVAANCVVKQIPSQPTARDKGLSRNGIPVFTDPDSHGLQQVWRVGTGVMLLHRVAFENVPHSCWAMTYDQEFDTYQGEDWGLCQALEKLDIPIFIDHDLSREIGHEGYLNFTHDLVGELQ